MALLPDSYDKKKKLEKNVDYKMSTKHEWSISVDQWTPEVFAWSGMVFGEEEISSKSYEFLETEPSVLVNVDIAETYCRVLKTWEKKTYESMSYKTNVKINWLVVNFFFVSYIVRRSGVKKRWRLRTF